MVFFNQVADLGAAEEKLVYENVPAIGLASDQSKQLRKLAIDQFKAERVKLLLTTDIAARGLDFTGVPYVVNVDVPLTEESYIHRSGRVGRMGAQGAVITFINDGTKRDYQRLMKQLAIPYQEIFLYDGALHEQPKAKDELEKERSQRYVFRKKSTKERKPETVNSVVKEPQETRKKKKNKKKNTKTKELVKRRNNALRASSRTLYRGGFHEISEGRNLSVTSKNETGLTAGAVAEQLMIDRSNASRYLNELFKEKKITRSTGRPVIYSVPTINEGEQVHVDESTSVSFDTLVGANDSLKVSIQQAKAAILYPPRGLHTIIFGKTGTGKSLFAECMYRFAIDSKTLDEDAPFVSFNCADYAQNPQLLFGHIFGVKRRLYWCE